MFTVVYFRYSRLIISVFYGGVSKDKWCTFCSKIKPQALELADYENESNAVEATHESLLNTLAFAPSSSGAAEEPLSSARPARVLVLFTAEGKPAGLALYFYNYSTWRSKPGIYLEDLYVRVSERGHGHGQKLLGMLAQEVLDMNGGGWSGAC